MEVATPLPIATNGADAVAVARECAQAARTIIRAGYGNAGVRHVKGRGNVVTDIDFAVERAVTGLLAARYPDHAVLSEETAAETRSDGWLWVVDPLDGTKNFSRGLPHFCFTIALCHAMRPVVALTHHPLLDEEFLAVEGEGTALNGERVHVSDARTVRESVLAVDLGYDGGRARRQLEMALALWPGMQALRVAGSAALGFAYAAAGRWDFFVHSDLQPWDVAAGLLLVREAGGTVTDRDGAPATILSSSAAAGAPGVHADLFALAGGLPWRA